jgi:hypothetical protein
VCVLTTHIAIHRAACDWLFALLDTAFIHCFESFCHRALLVSCNTLDQVLLSVRQMGNHGVLQIKSDDFKLRQPRKQTTH